MTSTAGLPSTLFSQAVRLAIRTGARKTARVAARNFMRRLAKEGLKNTVKDHFMTIILEEVIKRVLAALKLDELIPSLLPSGIPLPVSLKLSKEEVKAMLNEHATESIAEYLGKDGHKNRLEDVGSSAAEKYVLDTMKSSWLDWIPVVSEAILIHQITQLYATGGLEKAVEAAVEEEAKSIIFGNLASVAGDVKRRAKAAIKAAAESGRSVVLWGFNRAQSIYTSVIPDPPVSSSLRWTKVAGTCVHVDSSNKWVYIVNKAYVYRKPVDNSAAGWTRMNQGLLLNRGLNCISVTDRFAWGCNSNGRIYFARSDAPGKIMGWKVVAGKCKQLHACGRWVYIVNKAQNIYRKPADNSAAGWTRLNGGLNCVSVTDRFVWGCNSNGNIYYARSDAPAKAMGWKQVAGNCKQLHACGRWVYCVDKKDNVHRKPADNSAAGWTQVNGQLASIAVLNKSQNTLRTSRI